jgi:hypothetical protein
MAALAADMGVVAVTAGVAIGKSDIFSISQLSGFAHDQGGSFIFATFSISQTPGTSCHFLRCSHRVKCFSCWPFEMRKLPRWR